jgi:hypothetical protein
LKKKHSIREMKSNLEAKIILSLIIVTTLLSLWLAGQSPEIIAPAEVRTDDGTYEWATYLADVNSSIQKELVLLDHVVGYHRIFLKIFMSGANRLSPQQRHTYDLVVRVDGRVVKVYSGGVPHFADWYLIPLDPAIIRDKERIMVSLSVIGNPDEGHNYVSIYGDAGATTRFSSFNGQKADLSPYDGIQTGEYLIRLEYQ